MRFHHQVQALLRSNQIDVELPSLPKAKFFSECTTVTMTVCHCVRVCISAELSTGVLVLRGVRGYDTIHSV